MSSSATILRKTLLASALSSVLMSTAVMAEKHSEMTEHAAHEHGAARLTIATTSDGLEIALETPAANVFGFEYTPSSDSDHHAIHEAVEVFEEGAALFIANASAGCKPESVKIESAQVDAHDKEKHADGEHHDHDEDHKDDDHGDHKAEESHDKHEGKHDDHEHADHKDETAHNDVDVTWHFECVKPSELTQVDVKLFSAFPKGFEEIDVDWISADKAGHVELESDGTVTFK